MLCLGEETDWTAAEASGTDLQLSLLSPGDSSDSQSKNLFVLRICYDSLHVNVFTLYII